MNRSTRVLSAICGSAFGGREVRGRKGGEDGGILQDLDEGFPEDVGVVRRAVELGAEEGEEEIAFPCNEGEVWGDGRASWWRVDRYAAGGERR